MLVDKMGAKIPRFLLCRRGLLKGRGCAGRCLVITAGRTHCVFGQRVGVEECMGAIVPDGRGRHHESALFETYYVERVLVPNVRTRRHR